MKIKLILLLLLIPAICFTQQLTTSLHAEQIFDLVIQYYDPSGLWNSYRGEMHLYSLRPDGASKEEDLVIDNQADLYQSTLFLNGTQVTSGIRHDTVFFAINGRQNLTQEERSAYALNEKSIREKFHQYLLHFGFPMHMKQAGLLPDEQVEQEVFNGKSCLVLKFSEALSENGLACCRHPIHLLIDSSDYSIAGVRYPEGAEGGEATYALFSEELEAGGIRIPKVKTYYSLADSGYLLTDALSTRTTGEYGNLEREKPAIKKVLDDETYYFYVRDYNKWTKCWSHQNDVFLAFLPKLDIPSRKAGRKSVSTSGIICAKIPICTGRRSSAVILSITCRATSPGCISTIVKGSCTDVTSAYCARKTACGKSSI